MGSHIWSWYKKPPTNSTELVGRTFKHKEKDVEVLVIACYPLVQYITGKSAPGIKDLPGMVHPALVVRLLTGELAGHEYAIGSGTFCTLFSEKT
jgi:hypothetical protein